MRGFLTDDVGFPACLVPMAWTATSFVQGGCNFGARYILSPRKVVGIGYSERRSCTPPTTWDRKQGAPGVFDLPRCARTRARLIHARIRSIFAFGGKKKKEQIISWPNRICD
jgi:hypothetical protein